MGPFVLSSTPMSGKEGVSIHLGLGSNLGERFDYLQESVDLLHEQVSEMRLSAIYESAAWGFEDQGDFLNAAVAGRTQLSPQELLAFAKDIESQLGREPTFRNGPRVIDIDILLYGDTQMQEGPLVIPHPSLVLRSFVLQPLVDLSPDLIPPGSEKSLRETLAAFDPDDLHPHYVQQFESQ